MAQGKGQHLQIHKIPNLCKGAGVHLLIQIALARHLLQHHRMGKHRNMIPCGKHPHTGRMVCMLVGNKNALDLRRVRAHLAQLLLAPPGRHTDVH